MTQEPGVTPSAMQHVQQTTKIILAIIKETMSRAKAHVHIAVERNGQGGATAVRRGPRGAERERGMDKARIALLIHVAALVELHGKDERKRCLELA